MIDLLATYYVNGKESSGAEAALMIVGVISLIIGLRVIAGRMDKKRIREELERTGCTVVFIRWDPFGRGWFGEESDRNYEVSYLTPDGEPLVVSCKTSLTTGIFWSADEPPTRFTKPSFKSRNTKPDAEAQACPSCGKTAPTNARFCPNCGERL